MAKPHGWSPSAPTPPPLHWHPLVSSFNSATWRELYKKPKRSVAVADRQKIFAYWPQKKSKIKCGFGSWLTAHDATATAAYWFLHRLPAVPLLLPLSLPPSSLFSSPLFSLFSFCFAKTLPCRLANLNWTRFKRRYQSRRVSPLSPFFCCSSSCFNHNRNAINHSF